VDNKRQSVILAVGMTVYITFSSAALSCWLTMAGRLAFDIVYTIIADVALGDIVCSRPLFILNDVVKFCNDRVTVIWYLLTCWRQYYSNLAVVTFDCR